jgi:hypothetical protein
MRRLGLVLIIALALLAIPTPVGARAVVAELLNESVTAAVTGVTPDGVISTGFDRVESLTLHATFTYGSGGTNATAYVQTSLDGGASWVDIASFQFTTTSAKRAYHLTAAAVTSITTPTEGTLTANTAVNGLLGDRYRVKLTTTGTYAGGTTLVIHALPK